MLFSKVTSPYTTSYLQFSKATAPNMISYLVFRKVSQAHNNYTDPL